MAFLPKQKISKDEKDLEWFINNIEYRIQDANYYSADIFEMVRLYKAADGELEDEAYKHVLNPYNSTSENIVDYPANLVNFNIITPILNTFLGEKANKPFNHQVIVANPNSDNDIKRKKNDEVKNWLQQEYINKINALGFNTGVATKQQDELEAVLQKFKVSYSDQRAIKGQEAVDYLKYDLDLKHKYQEGFYDWLVTGRVYSYKNVYKNDVTHDIVPPLELRHGTTKTGFIEDSDWALRITRYNISQIIDLFNKVLTPEEIDRLEQMALNGESSPYVDMTIMGQSVFNIDKAANVSNQHTMVYNTNLIDVKHCVWKGFVKVGILSYIDEFGQPQEMEVSEDYKLNKENGDIEIEWVYNNCVYECYKIGKDIYKLNREVLVQRHSLSNTSDVKLPYNGFVGYNERSIAKSVVKQLMAYQAEYNICQFRRSLALAKNKDKILMMPIGVLPDDFGTGSEGMIKYLQFVESTGIGFFDEKKNGALSALNALKSVDLGLGNYVEFYTSMLNELKNEAWDIVGMNRQRYGDVMASDGKGNTEQAIIRSSVISREIFRRFERFEESDIQGLIDNSKVAWVEGKKGMYITGDGTHAFLNIEEGDFLETDYGIFAVDSDEEASKLKTAKDYAFGWAQKGTQAASTVIEILDSSNISTLKAKIIAIEEEEKKYKEQVQQQQAEQNQQLQQMKNDSLQAELNNKIEVAKIQAGTNYHINSMNNEHEKELNGDDDKNANGIPDNGKGVDNMVNYLADQKAKYNLQQQKLGLDSSKAIADQRFKAAKLELDRKKFEESKKSKKT